MLRADGGRNQVIQMRGMTKNEYAREIFVFGKFAEQLHGFGAGKQQIRLADFVFGIFELFGKKFGSLESPQIGTRENQIRNRSYFRRTFRDLPGLFDSLWCQEALRIRRTFGVLAVDGHPVAHDVQLHETLASLKSVYKSKCERGVTSSVLLPMSKVASLLAGTRHRCATDSVGRSLSLARDAGRTAVCGIPSQKDWSCVPHLADLR